MLAATVSLTLLAGFPPPTRWDGYGRRAGVWWRRALLATYVVPHTILFIPIYQVIIRLGLDDSHGALVLIYTTMALPFCGLDLVGVLPPLAAGDRGVRAGGGRHATTGDSCASCCR